MEDKYRVKLTCPSCGFIAFFGSKYGSFEICPVCDWEDDAVQLNNPASGGGANKVSLIESQEKSLTDFPLTFNDGYGLKRDPLWRPISESEKKIFKEERIIEPWYNRGFSEPKYAYWNWGRDLYQDIGKIFAKWDPIGVPDEIAFDEYQSYIPKAIKAASDEIKLREFLIWLIRDQIGLNYDENNDNQKIEIEEIGKKIIRLVNQTKESK